jgi:hypothetical protein
LERAKRWLQRLALKQKRREVVGFPRRLIAPGQIGLQCLLGSLLTVKSCEADQGRIANCQPGQTKVTLGAV